MPNHKIENTPPHYEAAGYYTCEEFIEHIDTHQQFIEACLATKEKNRKALEEGKITQEEHAELLKAFRHAEFTLRDEVAFYTYMLLMEGKEIRQSFNNVNKEILGIFAKAIFMSCILHARDPQDDAVRADLRITQKELEKVMLETSPMPDHKVAEAVSDTYDGDVEIRCEILKQSLFFMQDYSLPMLNEEQREVINQIRKDYSEEMPEENEDAYKKNYFQLLGLESGQMLSFGDLSKDEIEEKLEQYQAENSESDNYDPAIYDTMSRVMLDYPTRAIYLELIFHPDPEIRDIFINAKYDTIKQFIDNLCASAEFWHLSRANPRLLHGDIDQAMSESIVIIANASSAQKYEYLRHNFLHQDKVSEKDIGLANRTNNNKSHSTASYHAIFNNALVRLCRNTNSGLSQEEEQIIGRRLAFHASNPKTHNPEEMRVPNHFALLELTEKYSMEELLSADFVFPEDATDDRNMGEYIEQILNSLKESAAQNTGDAEYNFGVYHAALTKKDAYLVAQEVLSHWHIRIIYGIGIDFSDAGVRAKVMNMNSSQIKQLGNCVIYTALLIQNTNVTAQKTQSIQSDVNADCRHLTSSTEERETICNFLQKASREEREQCFARGFNAYQSALKTNELITLHNTGQIKPTALNSIFTIWASSFLWIMQTRIMQTRIMQTICNIFSEHDQEDVKPCGHFASLDMAEFYAKQGLAVPPQKAIDARDHEQEKKDESMCGDSPSQLSDMKTCRIGNSYNTDISNAANI